MITIVRQDERFSAPDMAAHLGMVALPCGRIARIEQHAGGDWWVVSLTSLERMPKATRELSIE